MGVGSLLDASSLPRTRLVRSPEPWVAVRTAAEAGLLPISAALADGCLVSDPTQECEEELERFDEVDITI